MGRCWHAVKIDIPDAVSDIAASAMQEIGTCGSVEERSERPGHTRLVSYFDREAFDEKKLRRELAAVIGRMPALEGISFEIASQPDADWAREWRRFFKAFEIIPGVAIVPSWERCDGPDGNIVISLDPGMAFGTGLHATTRLCAAAMKLAAEEKRPGSLLDVGSGSGILAILAKKIGFERTGAVEDDEEARQVAAVNFEKNGIADVETRSSIDLVDGCFDVVVANILLSTLMGLHDELIKRLSGGGRLILSGITNEQESEIEGLFSQSLMLAAKSRLDEWSCLVYAKGE